MRRWFSCEEYFSEIYPGYQGKREFGKIMATTSYFVKKIGVTSVAQFGAVIGMIIGTINGIMPALSIAQSSAISSGLVPGVSSGIMTFCINIILGFFLGFVGGAVIAFIYNLAPWGEMGGIKVELEAGL
ncbi:MAG: hypothetical protein WC379_15040 [Methanoregula sp.]|jgi:uncharacterized protein YqgC (DUF456 family)